MVRFPSCLTALALLFSMAAAQAASSGREPCVIPAGTASFEFQSGSNLLRGFVDLPDRSARHPAIIIVHGGGDSDVTVDPYYDEMRRAFRDSGIATVLWDKAGNGCSSGTYSSTLPLHERASETMAAIDALKRRQDIDTSRVGLWALSLGGLVAPMAAVRSSDIAYLIVVNGLGSDALSQGAYLSIRILRDAGVDETEARLAYEALRRGVSVMRAGGTYEESLAASASVQKYPALRSMYQLDEAGVESVQALLGDPQWSLTAGHFLRHLKRPTLAIFGKRDDVSDWREGIDVYRAAFAGQEIRNLTLKTFANADHEMRPSETKSVQGSIFVHGYIDTMIKWLKSKGFANPS